MGQKVDKKGGGICVYVNKKIKVDAQIHQDLNVSSKDIELFILDIQQPFTKPVIVVSVYRSPQGK